VAKVSNLKLGDAGGELGGIDIAEGGFRRPLYAVSALRYRRSHAIEFLVQYFLGMALISGKKQ
jgi:hypothetical protein